MNILTAFTSNSHRSFGITGIDGAGETTNGASRMKTMTGLQCDDVIGQCRAGGFFIWYRQRFALRGEKRRQRFALRREQT